MNPFSSASAVKTTTHASLAQDLPFGNETPCRMIRAGADGNIKLGYSDGSSDTIPVKAGEHLPVLAVKVFSVGTTAFPITVFY